jgi:uncharacterized membrane protein
VYKSLLFLHIFGVFMIVGGAAIATALGIKGSKSVHTRTIAAFSGLSIIAERYVITPGAILALVAGSLLVHQVSYSFNAGWIVASYVLWVVAMSIGWGVLGRHSVRLNRHAKQLVAEGVESSDELGLTGRASLRSTRELSKIVETEQGVGDAVFVGEGVGRNQSQDPQVRGRQPVEAAFRGMRAGDHRG